MTDLANKLRRYSRKIAHPAGDVPSVMLAAADEIDRLRAKIERMEQQEPVAWTTKLALEYGASTLGFQVSGVNMWGENGVPLYALPGAQPAPSIPEFCPCCGNIMRACMCCSNEDCNAVTVTPEQAKYNKQHAIARKASGAAAPEAKP